MNSLAVVQQQMVEVPQSSWIGNMSMAGVGLALLGLSAWCIKGRKRRKSNEIVPMGPWGPLFVSFGDRLIERPTERLFNSWAKRDDLEGVDWKSLMTWAFGAFATTAILSSQPGTVLSLMHWVQGLVEDASGWPILSDIGAAGLCFALLLAALRNRDDDMKDLMYGAISGLIFPLGGGWWAGVTFHIGHWIPQLLHLG